MHVNILNLFLTTEIITLQQRPVSVRECQQARFDSLVLKTLE